MIERAAMLIDVLSLKPHPEGGYYGEIFRSPRSVRAGGSQGARSALTTIYFLILRGEPSRWHRVMADEVWHFLEGSPAELLIMDEAGARIRRQMLGSVASDAKPAAVVPAGHWQAARTQGDYTLAGCTVGPGFEFSDFMLLRDDPVLLDQLRRSFPDHVDLV